MTYALTTKLFCEVFVRKILPAMRALVAKVLVRDYGLTQLEASKVLGVTQASINYYLTGKRGQKLLSELESIDEINRLAKDMAKELMEDKGDPSSYLCKLCLMLKLDRKMLVKVLNALGEERVRVSLEEVV